MTEKHTKTVAPYGHWQSPISTDLVLQKATALSEVLIPANSTSAADVAWVELRMSESGRSALMHSSSLSSDDATEVSAGQNARSGVHEYGGGSAASLADGSFIFTDYNPKRFDVFHAPAEGKQGAQVVTEENSAIRYADFGAHPTDTNLCLAVEEDHSEDTPSTVVNSIVLLDLKQRPARVHTLLKGRKAEEQTEDGPQKRDFYTYPRFSPNGKFVSWITWNHPSMPWWDTQLWVARFDNSNPDEPQLAGASLIKLGSTETGKQQVYQEPVWAIPSHPNQETGKLFFACDATGYLNLYSTSISSSLTQDGVSVSTPIRILPEPVENDFIAPNWTLNNSDYIPLSPDLLIVTFFSGAKQNLGLINLRRPRLIRLDTPFVSITQLRRLSSTSFALIAARADEPSALLAISLSALASNNYTLKDSNITIIKRSSSLVWDGTIDKGDLSIAREIDFPTTLPNGEKAVAHAIIFAPKNKNFVGPKGKAPPCVFNVHGGPSSSAGMGFNLPTQFWTSRGFMVCSVNYGGSTGYGRQYLQRLNSEWGVTDVLDCVAAAKFLGSKASLGDTLFGELSEKEKNEVCKELEAGGKGEKEEEEEEVVVVEQHKLGGGGVKVVVNNTSSAWGSLDLVLAGVSVGAAVMAVGFVGNVMENYSHCIPSLVRPKSLLSRYAVQAGVAIVSLLPYIYSKMGRVVSESVSILPGMGVQLSTRRALSLLSRDYFQRCSSRLVPEDRMLDIYIGEGYRHFSIVDYLTLTTRTTSGEGARIERLFPNLLPRLPTVQRIYRFLSPHLPSNSPIDSSSSEREAGSLADPNALLISGGSAGGYTVLACLCFHPTIFAGGCSRYGVCSLQLLAEESHKFESQYPFQLIGGTPKSLPKVYHDRSPIYAASKIKAPILLLQGSEDKVVPKSQADEFVRQLKKAGGEQGKDWRYKVYHGEAHGFRKAENVKDSLEEELRWWIQRCLPVHN
ncbi:hypothetical protein NDA11_000893 [Ustilago hordei]|uniref:Dipeptidyl-peptidase V n=1 Tax=Ustilago hordei TaxID=120017 RepID=I2G2T9_USTHO|nr:uncharacterized protein UHO2_02883 [Ustilago hordei]KAJ1038284.1 hypothetical protein NDA10_007481 [Ustilago hordei]KAJ1585188.1 hypothetical protein NDA15_003896 [Ustilago hordei]KAJ1592707.1 hypothetical protein NDA11_000893 [Ustilago hordei]KAJ1601618.1 hypothetical protein NDA14_004605 [Ustilago hordei]CCF53482.1 uncharacterized protein UHOR_02317 [Ustilago hordei]